MDILHNLEVIQGIFNLTYIDMCNPIESNPIIKEGFVKKIVYII